METDTLPMQSHPNPQPDTHHRKIELQSAQDLIYLQNNLAKSALSKLDLHFPRIAAEPEPEPATVISLDGPSSQQQQQQLNNSDDSARTGAPKTDGEVKGDDSLGIQEGEETDPFRLRVRTLITEFLTQTWSNAQQNLTLNGIDATDLTIPHTATLDPVSRSVSSKDGSSTTDPATSRQPTEKEEEQEGITFTYQPFDPKLQHKLAGLHGELEKLTAEVSKLRRTAPATSSRNYQDRLDDVLREDEERFVAYHSAVGQKPRVTEDVVGDVDMDVDTDRGEEQEKEEEEIEGIQFPQLRKNWNRDVESVYRVGVRELSGLATASSHASSSSSPSTSTSRPPRKRRRRDGDDVDNNDGDETTVLTSTNEHVNAPSLTEVMGKVGRARGVVMDME